ncbi:MAG: radical SAM protein [Salinivirgaceae bacterium]
MITFGPIPSRRLGKSLGINNIPSHKKCTYSCIYCQVGLTKKFTASLTTFYNPEVIYDETQKHLEKLAPADYPDYLTFVSNGEPTLDIQLGKTIDRLKEFNIPIAVITNASLLHLPEVRSNLCKAQWVSVKVDTSDEAIWKTINRPHPSLSFSQYKENLITFASEFKGTLVSETMLVQAVNDAEQSLEQTAQLIKTINPKTAFISIPIRPPAIKTVSIPDEETLNLAYQIYTETGLNTELILGFEGTNTGFTGNIYEDILNICTVHPIREETMQELLAKNNASFSVVNSLMHNHLIREVHYQEKRFYVRQFQ